jgi:hypothetical protein
VTEQTRISRDVRHYVVVIVVFGITGSIAVLFARGLLTGLLGLEGSLCSGPWSFRIVYLLLIPPSYSATLIVVGTAFGKGAYFRRRVLRPWVWLLRVSLQRVRRAAEAPTPGSAEPPRDR